MPGKRRNGVTKHGTDGTNRVSPKKRPREGITSFSLPRNFCITEIPGVTPISRPRNLRRFIPKPRTPPAIPVNSAHCSLREPYSITTGSSIRLMQLDPR